MEAAVHFPVESDDRFLVVDVSDQSVSLNRVVNCSRGELHHASIVRHARLPNFGAFDSNIDGSLVALGLVSGSASLIRLQEDNRSSEPISTFKLKQQRKCNSIALSTQNWLAVALDRTRSDVSLTIFDANVDQNQGPVRRLCPAELVSSVRFFAKQPNEIVVAAQRSCIRLFDLRDGAHSGNALQVATSNANYITLDPQNENFFASTGFTGDPSTAIWDKRALSHGPILEFVQPVHRSEATTIRTLRFSRTHRSRLAVGSSTGEVRVFDLNKPSNWSTNSQIGYAQDGRSHWTTNHFVSHTRTLERAVETEDVESGYTNKIITFDWIPESFQSTEPSILTLRSNRALDVLSAPCAIPQAGITARNDCSLGLEEIIVKEVKRSAELNDAHSNNKDQSRAEDFGPSEYMGESKVEDIKVTCTPNSVHLAELLMTCTLQQQRCQQGYLFDCNLNARIVSGDWRLERLWEIVEHLRRQASDGGMIAGSLDLSFVGVTGICQERIGSLSRRKLTEEPAKVEDAIYALCMQRELPSFEGERTNFPEHRQLSLLLCGWSFDVDTLEEECQDLIERGLYYQAIVQATLHDERHIALNMLRQLIRSKTLPNIGLGALLASDSINDEQREMCLWMAADTDDPALKALLTYLASGDWRDVMKTSYLHMGYRVALALKYLNDTEIKGFLQSETARAIKNGDLEGLLLTGLGEQAMDLLQNYVARSNDLQTAVLATAFTNPRYIDDVRWEMWKETYFMQMQSWRAFTQRARLIVQHSQMSKTATGESLLEAPRRQMTLECSHCRTAVPTTHQAWSSVKPRNELAVGIGIVCPSCGRHMPRCSICGLWLGAGDASKGKQTGAAEKAGGVQTAFVMFCAKCKHVSHADHAKQWFEKHSSCPVPGCGCACR